MSNETSDDSFLWKERLNRLDRVKGEDALDKEVAWNKLHGRLKGSLGDPERGEPRRRKALLYWMAAATVLSGLFLATLFVHKKQLTMANTQKTKFPIADLLVKRAPSITKNNNTASQASFKGHAPALPLDKERGWKQRTQVASDTSVVIHVQTPGMAMASPFPTGDSMVLAKIDTKVPTHKMQVLSVNELNNLSGDNGGPPIIGSTIAHKDHLFQIKWLRNDEYTEAATQREQPVTHSIHLTLYGKP